MNIGIDVRPLASGPYTGVANVVRHLLPPLFALADNDRFVLFFVSGRGIPRDVALWQKQFSHVIIRARHIPGRLFDAATRFFPRALPDYAKKCDVLLSPNINIVTTNTPRVLVVHDLSFARYPEFLSPLQRYWHWLMNPKEQARGAGTIIVPSFATKEDVVKLWDIDAEKIHIVPWGGPEFRDQGSGIRDQGNPYILSLGAAEPRKNFVTLVRAFEIMKNVNARLIIAGPSAYGIGEIRRAISSSFAKDRIELRGFVSEEEKEKLLLDAAVFVYPSLLEGFGLPVLEAMAAGVPVVASNRSSLPEVMGEAGILVDPYKPEEIAQAVDAVLADQELAAELSRRGKERAQQFTWEKTAETVLEILRTAAKDSV